MVHVGGVSIPLALKGSGNNPPASPPSDMLLCCWVVVGTLVLPRGPSEGAERSPVSSHPGTMSAFTIHDWQTPVRFPLLFLESWESFSKISEHSEGGLICVHEYIRLKSLAPVQSIILWHAYTISSFARACLRARVCSAVTGAKEHRSKNKDEHKF